MDFLAQHFYLNKIVYFVKVVRRAGTLLDVHFSFNPAYFLLNKLFTAQCPSIQTIFILSACCLLCIALLKCVEFKLW